MAEQKGKKITYVEAVNRGIREEMRRDKSVLVWGEDVRFGVFGVTKGLVGEFGEERVLDAPLSEVVIAGAAVGAALTGVRPVVEIMFGGFLATCFDAIFMKMGTWQQRYGGGFPMPLVIRASTGSTGTGTGPEHAVCPEALLMQAAGLKVVMPPTPYDAIGLMKSAIRDDDPVIYLEHLGLFNSTGIVPEEEFVVPLGKADIKREGKDVTIVTYSAMLFKALAAADKLSQEGISAEVVDLRSLVPLDEETLLKSVEKTGRVVIVHEAMKRAGAAGEIAFRIMEKGFDFLNGPIKRVGALNLALTKSAKLEQACIPQEQDIIKAVKELF